MPGRPSLFRTTDVFLRTMGITRLDELPLLPDMSSSEGIEKLQQAIDEIQNAQNRDQMTISEITESETKE